MPHSQHKHGIINSQIKIKIILDRVVIRIKRLTKTIAADKYNVKLITKVQEL